MPWNDMNAEFFLEVQEVLRQEFRAAPTQPAPELPDEEPMLAWAPPPPPPVPVEFNTIAASYDDLLQTIEELKAGRLPEDDFEHEICAAIQRNKTRDAEAAAIEEVSRPSRFDRI